MLNDRQLDLWRNDRMRQAKQHPSDSARHFHRGRRWSRGDHYRAKNTGIALRTFRAIKKITMTTPRPTTADMLAPGTVVLDGTCKVRLLSTPRRVSGGDVVDVERAEDSTDPAMRLQDGSIHPAHRAGFRWTAVVGNLRALPVTGPDGDNPITDEQIRELIASRPDVEVHATAIVALAYPGDLHGNERRGAEIKTAARARCAAAYNARHAGKDLP